MPHESHENNTGFFDSEYLRTNCFCPLCQVGIPNIDIRVLKNTESATLFHLKCKKCHGATVILNYAGQMGVHSIGILTDLTSHEILRTLKSRPITSEETLLWYSALKNFSGDPRIQKEFEFLKHSTV